MPDISYNISARVSKGALVQNFNASNVTADIATAGILSVTLNLSTSPTTVGTATMGAIGLCFARNLATAATHTVSFGRYVSGTLHETVRLRGNEAALLRLAPGDYAAVSAVAGSRLLLNIIED